MKSINSCGAFLFAVLAGIAMPPSAAANIVNGDFENGLTGWTFDPGEWATLEAAGGNHVAFSDVGGELRQIFNLPIGAQTIEFDFGFFHFGPGKIGSLGDSVSFFLWDAVTHESVIPSIPEFGSIPIFYNQTSDGNIAFNSDYMTLTPGTGDDPDHVSLDVSHVPASQSIEIIFQLWDLTSNDIDGLLAVDNVVVTVPEPASACLGMAALAVFVGARRRATRSRQS